MTTLGDGLTPTTLTSETSGVSVKVEQGVLCENNEEYRRNIFNAEERDTLIIKCESSQSSDTGNNSNSMCNGDYNNVSQVAFQPGYEIKEEPDVDIDDRHPDEETEENTRFHTQTANENPNAAPKITLTPTSKLIATSNGTVDNKRRFVCPYENCTKSYGKSSHLRSHLTWHTGIKPFVCKEPGCGKGFTRSDELNRHIRTHTGEKPFECVQCSKKFSRSDHLTKHLATHFKQLAAINSALAKKIKIEKNVSQENVTTLSTIEPKAINPNVLENKLDSPESITNCLKDTPVAGRSEIKLEKPENSEDYVMSMPEQQSNSHCQTLPVAPPESSIKMETNVVVKPEPLDESQVSEFTERSCPIEPDDDAIMPEANLPPLSQNSAIITQSASQLNQTINNFSDSVYDPTRPFPCSHCAKSFKRQDDLNRHKRTHTGEKPFACNECDKRFMRSDHLKKHLNTHTRVR